MTRKSSAREADIDTETSGEDLVACEFTACDTSAHRDEMHWCGDCSTHACSAHFVTHVDRCSACHTEKGGDESYDESEDDFDSIEDNESNTYQPDELDGFTFDRFE